MRKMTLIVALALSGLVHADKITLVAGQGKDKPFHGPFGIDFAPDKTAWVVELEGGRVHHLDATGNSKVVGGKAETKGDAGDGGPLSGTVFNGMHSLAIHPSGDIYLADTWNARVRKVHAKTGLVTTVAGIPGKKGFTQDGPAASTPIGDPFCIAFGPGHKKLYMADLTDRRILTLDLATGKIELVAGNGKTGTPKDGADAKSSPLVDARAVAVDSKGNVYILERNGNALRVVDAAGKIRTVVNASGKKGAEGDGGDAIKATMNGPKHICIDPQDNVVIADAENHLVRLYSPATGKITRIAGTGKKGAAGLGGDPLQSELARPHGVTYSPDGTLYIVDSYNNRILRIQK